MRDFIIVACILVFGMMGCVFIINSYTACQQGKSVADVYRQNEAADQKREVEIPAREREAQKKAAADAADRAEAKKIWEKQ